MAVTSKSLSPREAQTENKICALRTDNKDTAHFWIMIHKDYVTICEQAVGKPAGAQLDIPRREFNTLIDWYMRKQDIAK